MNASPNNAPASVASSRNQAKVQLAIALVIFLVAATLPYSWLIAHFGYDDILREPTGVILTRFHAGGASLVLAWFSFAMSSLLFIPVALSFKVVLTSHDATDAGATTLAIASAIAQAVGLLRWVLVVPGLAAAFADPATSEATRATLSVVFDVVHHYGGMVIGEMVGQLLLAGWTALICVQLYRTKVTPRWIAIVGLLTLPFWLLGQTELLHLVVPVIPSIEVIPLAFMGWEAWLLLVAISMLYSAWKKSRVAGPVRLAE